MKIKLLAYAALALAASTGTSFADGNGTFGFGIELDGTGAGATNSGVKTLYALDNSGTTRLSPVGSTATLQQTEWPSSSTGTSASFSLGSFTIGSGATLTLTGGSMLTYKTVTDDNYWNVNGATLNYQIYSSPGSPGATFTPVTLNFNENNVASNSGDQRWATESLSTNLLSGLTAGTYVLDVYGDATTDHNGTQYETDGGPNFGATFTVLAAPVVPEPGTWAMMVGGLVMLFGFQALRRKSVV